MLKRLLSLLLTIVLVVGLVPPGSLASSEVTNRGSVYHSMDDLVTRSTLQDVSIAAANLESKQQGSLTFFEDVKPSDWFYDAVHYAEQNGLFQGTGENHFSPLGTMTRAMFVTVLGRMAGIQPSDYTSPDFTDVVSNAWYAPYVQWAVEQHITSGTGARTFSPNTTISREQMATFTVRFFEALNIPLESNQSSVPEPKDIANAASWAVPAIIKLWQAGLIQGDTQGNYNPKTDASRAEAATFLMRSNKVVTNPRDAIPSPSPGPNETPNPIQPPTSSSSVYTISFESNGGSELDSYTVSASQQLGLLPPSYLADHIFIGWYTNRELTEPAYEDIKVTKNMTLYARYESTDSNEAPPSASRIQSELDQDKLHTISIYSEHNTLTASDVQAGLVFESVSDPNFADTTGVKVTGSNGRFTVAANNTEGAFIEGDTYRITLTNEAISFTNYEDAIRELVFSISRQEVHNLPMNPHLVNIKASDISEMKINGSQEEVSPNSLPFMEMQIGNEGANETVINDSHGTFKYSGNAISLGDTIAIYEGLEPQLRDLTTTREENAPVSYVEVVAINGDEYSFNVADIENVLFFPDILPIVKHADTDGNLDDDRITVRAEEFVYDAQIYDELGIKRGFEVQVGDFLVLHTETTAIDMMEKYDRIVRITSVAVTNEVYTITFIDSTREEVMESISYYERPELYIEDLNTHSQVRRVEEKIEQQVTESGFAEKAAQFLLATVIETEGYEELQQEYDLPVEELQKMATSPLSVASNKTSKVRFEMDPTKDIKATVSIGGLKHFEGKKGVFVKVDLEARVIVDVSEQHELIIKLVASFQDELGLDVSLSIDEVRENWFFTDTIGKATIDFLSYTAVNFDTNIGLYEKNAEDEEESNEEDEDDDKKLENEITQQIQDIVNGKSNEDGGISDSFADMYKDMLENDTEWVSLIDQLLAKIPIGSPQTLLVAEINLSFVVSAMVNISIGAVFNYEINKRLIVEVNIDKAKVTHNLITTKDEFTFTLYVMGTIGLRAGIKGTVEVGILLISAASVGFELELGAYIQFWGYFYYQLKVTVADNPKNLTGPQIRESTSEFRGDYLLEIGVYARFALFAQALARVFEVKRDLFNEQFPIIHLGNKSSLIGFPELEEDEEREPIHMGDKKSIKLSSDVFKMEVMPLKEGGISTESKNPSQFTYQFTNSSFSYNPEKNELKYNGNETFDETQMTLTWKDAEKFLQPELLSLTIDITYGVLEDHYTISLFSLEYAGQKPTLIQTVEVAYNDSVPNQAIPTRTGYQFDRWTSDDKGTVEASFPDTMPARNLNYYAQWKRDPAVKYTVRIQFLDPSTNKFYVYDTITDTVPEGTTLHNSREYEHYYSLGSTPFTVRSGAYNTKDYYYAPESYTVTYDTGVPNVVPVIRQYEYGSVISTSPISVAGYKFRYWEYTNASGLTERLNPYSQVKIKGDMVIRGVYSPEIVKIHVDSYVIDSLTGSLTYADSMYFYSPVGSSYTASQGQLINFDPSFVYVPASNPPKPPTIEYVTPDANQTVNLYYEKAYKLTFDAVGGVGGTTKTLIAGTSIEAPVVSKSGFVFDGWSPAVPAVMPNSAQTYKALWIPEPGAEVTYKIEYYLEDLVVADYFDYENYDDEFRYDKTYTKASTDTLISSEGVGSTVNLTPKEITGFTYIPNHSGNVVSGVVSADGQLTLKVYYSRNVYTLTFNEEFVDWETNEPYYFPIRDYKVKYGNIIRMEPPMDGEMGYIVGWEPIDGEPIVDDSTTVTMPARDLNYRMVYGEYPPL